MGFVITAYGCTHRCSFCSIPEMTGGKYLTHAPDAVIGDIRLLGDIPFIRMVDANTFGNPTLAMELADKIRQANIKKKFIADVRADTIVRHRELLKHWKEAGLYAVVVGFEDFHDARLAAYDKKYQGLSLQRRLKSSMNWALLLSAILSPLPNTTKTILKNWKAL